MQTMMRTGALSVGSSLSVANPRSACISSEASSVPCVSGSSVVSLKTPRGRSAVRHFGADRSSRRSSRAARLQRLTARAEQGSGVDEKVKEIASESAVEGAGVVDVDAKLKVEELRPVDRPGTAAEGLALKVQVVEDESAETAVEKDAALDVTSASAVEDPQTLKDDVKDDAQGVAADLGRSVEDAAVGLEEKAEELAQRQERDAEIVKKNEFHEDLSLSPASATPTEGDLTRSQAQEILVETAKDGYEVLKWAAEGVVAAAQDAKESLGVAKELVDKRLKSFGIAADDTKDVSTQVAEVAQKKYDELQGSASKFTEELQVNLEEKKAADDLKPESEKNRLGKLGQELQENIQDSISKATAEDGPLAKFNESVSENLTKIRESSQETYDKVRESSQETYDKVSKTSQETYDKVSKTSLETFDKVSKKSQDLLSESSEKGEEIASKASEKGEEVATKASESGGEVKDKAKENAEEFTSSVGGGGEDLSTSFAEERSTTSQPQSGDSTGDLKLDYEDERGNEQLKGQVSENDTKAALKFPLDEPLVIPSTKNDTADIGPEV